MRICVATWPGSLAAVAKLGYKGVEFAGFNNVAAKDIRKMLDDNGLQAVGCHTALNTLQGEEFDKTVEFNKTSAILGWSCRALPPTTRTAG